MKLIDTVRIWDAAAHNAFSDLIRYRERWLCAFREGETHLSADGALRIIVSEDGRHWSSLARIASPDADLRDPKLSVTADGQLMLLAAACRYDLPGGTYRSLTWFSDDGLRWGEPHVVGDPDFWLWRVAWHRGGAYGFGYDCRDYGLVRLYGSNDGKQFVSIVDCPFGAGFPNESSLAFDNDTAHCLLRRDGEPGTGLWGTAYPPYAVWTWQDLGVHIGGPHLLRLPDGRFVAAVRLYDGRIRTALCGIDPATAELTELLALPSGGDTSYPGLVFHEARLWISYYSSHEEKTAIYLARVDVGRRDGGRA